MTQQDLTAVIEQVVAAYNAKDFDTYQGFFKDDLTFCHHNRGFEFDNAQGLVDVLKVFASSLMPDRHMGEATRLVQAGNVVVRQQPWGGTAQEDIPGIGAKGEQVKLDLCSVYVFDGDKIAEYHDYG